MACQHPERFLERSQEGPGGCLAHTWTLYPKWSKPLSHLLKKSVNANQHIYIRMKLTYASANHKHVFVKFANIFWIFRFRGNPTFRLLPAIELLTTI